MFVAALLGGLTLGIVIARYNPYEVSRKWTAVNAMLDIFFGVCVVLGAYYHSGPRAIAWTVGLFVTSALLVLVHRLGHGRLKG